jgi:hypothetical protein
MGMGSAQAKACATGFRLRKEVFSKLLVVWRWS